MPKVILPWLRGAVEIGGKDPEQEQPANKPAEQPEKSEPEPEQDQKPEKETEKPAAAKKTTARLNRRSK